MGEAWKAGIRHVVYLMLENRSFDHLLGDLPKVPLEDRFDPARPRTNQHGADVFPQALGAARKIRDGRDPKHERPHVILQLEDDHGGFVRQYAAEYADLSREELSEVMKVHAHGSLPALHALADAFTVFTHWHASVPGPTWPNRLYALSGTSRGRVKMATGPLDLNLHVYDQPTLFDRLNEKGLSWRAYRGDFPLSFLFLNQLLPKNASRYDSLDRFYVDCTRRPDQFPAFTLVEPPYLGAWPCDDHPCHDVMGGQQLLANVYNTLRGNEALWRETLLFVLYDEHGGFYDHVPPPRGPPHAIPPDDRADEFTFDQLGLRVPALLISPWVGDAVVPDVFDHTAFLQFLIDWWGLGALGARAASYERTFEAAFLDGPENLGPRQLDRGPDRQKSAPDALSGHQEAILALSQSLEAHLDAPAVAPPGAEGPAGIAVGRADAFIARKKAEA